mmetsp:Transcript_16097/g.23454  ORF Transcript_16097/g.23454 Transcript_16097/m.23454 type:complete len:152 (+) Transcript_16097:230-685(+)
MWYVTNGIKCLKTIEMKRVIKNCYFNDGLISIALLEETYELAMKTFNERTPREEVEVYENEPEEDLGQIDEESEDTIEGSKDFEVEVNGNNSEDSPESESEEEEEEGGEEEEEQEEKPPKNKATRSGRTITPNKMIGCVKKGKYSCTEKMK